VASLVTDLPEALLRQTALLASLCQAGELAGIHLEGPFLSPACRGAQDPSKMQAPSAELVARVAEAAQGFFATMTIAPEFPGITPGGEGLGGGLNSGGGHGSGGSPTGADTAAPVSLPQAPDSAGLSVVEALAAVGAVPSFGHTDCTADQLQAAVEAAAKALSRAAAGELRRPRLPGHGIAGGLGGIGGMAEGGDGGLPGRTQPGAAAGELSSPTLTGDGTGGGLDDIRGMAGGNGERRPRRARSLRPTATHLFNGMRPIHHRRPGPALECLAQASGGTMVVELVADGVHLAPKTVADVFELAAPGAVMLVTDAMAAAGMPDGSYQLGPMAVTVTGGVARLTGGESIAGGTAHLIDVVRTTVVESKVPLAVAVRAASSTPAAVLGLAAEVGALRAGLRADLLLTDAGLVPREVYRGGVLLA
jgi:N-acetylglucosamine-6-phosphate deacetylase